MYDRQKHNKTYCEKNKENIKRKQREKRARMKEALEKLEAEPDEVKTESREPVSMASNCFWTYRKMQKVCYWKRPSVGHWLHLRLYTEH